MSLILEVMEAEYSVEEVSLQFLESVAFLLPNSNLLISCFA